MVDEKKIAFITCVNDEKKYKECIRYIKNICVPPGYKVEYISVTNQSSLTSAYNNAMKQTNAKYKVYLHQDTFIVNKNFIFDILRIFDMDKQNGMIGVIGAKELSASGIYWRGKTMGAVYENHISDMKLLKFADIEGVYDTVSAIDGLIMITQYDIPWREDLFDGWHFYDISQSTEFKLAGYNVVIPSQEETWCVHDCGVVRIDKEYDKYRRIFIEEYSEKIFPLVSILIPTYNRPNKFREALESALNQTYRNIEIIIGDDSTNEETKEIMVGYLNKYKNIKYFYNGGPLGEYGIKNHEKIYRESKGEYINYLMDDDIFHKEKIEKMMNYYLGCDNVSLVTSYRKRINNLGNKIADSVSTSKLCNEDSMSSGYEIARKLIIEDKNFIGEPTTVLLKRENINGDFGVYLGRRYKCMIDMAQWLECCLHGDVVYISEALSCFRVHAGQNQNKKGIILQSIIDRYHILSDSADKKVFGLDSREVRDLLDKWYKEANEFLKISKDDMLDLSELKRLLLEYSDGIKQS